MRPAVPLALVLALATSAPQVQGQGQEPIRIVFDMHSDPVPNGIPFAQKLSLMQTRCGYMNWVMDFTEPLGMKIAHLSTGQFMELVVFEGPGGTGAQTLQRIWQNGGQIGSHSHSEYRAGAFDWPNLPSGATLAQSAQSWTDNVTWVDNAILTAFNGAPPEALSAINCAKGSHLPSNEPDYHALMQQFGFTVRQGGPEEDYFAWYGHHIWNPFRPSAANYMDEDLSAPFVQSTQGSVIGVAGIHHGIYQDMTGPAVKRQFLQLYLNWRSRDRHGLPARVWSWGWGSHGEDFYPGSPSRAGLVDAASWIHAHFAGRIEPTGSQVLAYDTHRGVRDAYLAWEAANPGVKSFGGHSLAVDWNEYPYLRAVCEEMKDFVWSADLSLGAGVESYLLSKGPLQAVILWRSSGTSAVDLSAIVGPDVRVVDLETGERIGLDASAVVAGESPVIVTEDVSRMSLLGMPILGSSVGVRITGPPQSPAVIFVSGAGFDQSLPHYGRILIDPAHAAFGILGSGVVGGQAQFTLPVAIPSDPLWIGVTAHVQGAVVLFGGASARLADNALAVTIQ